MLLQYFGKISVFRDKMTVCCLPLFLSAQQKGVNYFEKRAPHSNVDDLALFHNRKVARNGVRTTIVNETLERAKVLDYQIIIFKKFLHAHILSFYPLYARK